MTNYIATLAGSSHYPPEHSSITGASFVVALINSTPPNYEGNGLSLSGQVGEVSWSSGGGYSPTSFQVTVSDPQNIGVGGVRLIYTNPSLGEVEYSSQSLTPAGPSGPPSSPGPCGS